MWTWNRSNCVIEILKKPDYLNTSNFFLFPLTNKAELFWEFLQWPEVVIRELVLALTATRRSIGIHSTEFDSLVNKHTYFFKIKKLSYINKTKYLKAPTVWFWSLSECSDLERWTLIALDKFEPDKHEHSYEYHRRSQL